MKALALLPLFLLTLSCTKAQELSPAETAKIVAESFFYNDKETLKKYTTQSGYTGLTSFENIFAIDKDKDSHFKVIKEETKQDVSWIKYSIAFDPNPEIFKLIKEDGRWKVTHTGPHEKGPFEE